MPTDNRLALFPASVPEVSLEIGHAAAAIILASMPEMIRRSRLGEFLDAEGVERETGLSRRQIRHLRDTRQLTFYKRGRLVLYRTQEVLDFVNAGKVPARSDRTDTP